MFSLAACGGGGDPAVDADDPILGRYESVSINAIFGWMEFDEIYDEGESYLELNKNGKGVMVIDGDKLDIKYTVDGDQLTMTAEGEEAKGTIKDGVIETGFFTVDDIRMVFAKEGAKVPEEYLPSEGGLFDEDSEDDGESGLEAPTYEIEPDYSTYAKTEDLNGKFVFVGEYSDGQYYYGEEMGYDQAEVDKTYLIFNGDGTGSYSRGVEDEETGDFIYSVEDNYYEEDGYYDCVMIPVGDYIYIQYSDGYYGLYLAE